MEIAIKHENPHIFMFQDRKTYQKYLYKTCSIWYIPTDPTGNSNKCTKIIKHQGKCINSGIVGPLGAPEEGLLKTTHTL